MTDKHDGGPAFPVTFTDGDGNSVAIPGMSLRDWFAGQAMQAFAGQPETMGRAMKSMGMDLGRIGEAISKAAYATADAMLAEREK